MANNHHTCSQTRTRINGPSYRYWQLTLPVMANLYWLGGTLLSDQPDNNTSYLFDKKSFFTAKVLNMAIPVGVYTRS